MRPPIFSRQVHWPEGDAHSVLLATTPSGSHWQSGKSIWNSISHWLHALLDNRRFHYFGASTWSWQYVDVLATGLGPYWCWCHCTDWVKVRCAGIWWLYPYSGVRDNVQVIFARKDEMWSELCRFKIQYFVIGKFYNTQYPLILYHVRAMRCRYNAVFFFFFSKTLRVDTP